MESILTGCILRRMQTSSAVPASVSSSANAVFKYVPKHHYHREHPRMRGTRDVNRSQTDTAFPQGSLSIAQVLTAYALLQNAFKGVKVGKIGYGSLGGGINQQDINNLCQATGCAAPSVKILEVAGGKNDPTDQDSTVEVMLDFQMIAFTIWWLTGEAAQIVAAFGPNAAGGMTAVTQALVDEGCTVISWSWGSAASGWNPAERAGLEAVFIKGVAKGVTFFAASGDNSVDDGTQARTPDYPASSLYVWAVGGTNLTVNDNGTRANEQAWGDGSPGDDGTGGGYDPTVALPAWQAGVVQGTHRGAPDSSANADPQSGYQISANGSWTVVGGTSASSPLTAAIVAVAKAFLGITTGMLTPTAYANRQSAFNDIVQGSNGDAAAPGWDDSTGNGSPNGFNFIQALCG
jgi:kumamolisin